MSFLLLAAILLPVTLFSQFKRDKFSFGNISKEELMVNTFDLDKNAEAVVLLDLGKMNFDISSGHIFQELQMHTRIKILKEDGLKRADIKLTYEHRGNGARPCKLLNSGGLIMIRRNMLT